ncbi:MULTISPECIES: hypothetical protein [Legionella]|nr:MULTISPECIES: hypothetical protein [Legionella]
MSHDKKSEKFKDESQDARRRDEHNLVHPDDKSSKNTHQRNDKKK